MWRWFLVLAAGCSFEVNGAAPGPGPGDAGPSDSSVDGGIDGATPTDASPIELSIAIQASNDDALQDPNGTMNVAYAWISLYSGDHWGALRFPLAGIERNATITEAYLDLVVDSTAEDSPAVQIKTAASADPTPLTTTASNISTRMLGTTVVAWNENNIGSGVKRTPAVTTLVQERVDDAAWAPGNHVMFVFDAQPSAQTFEVRQYDHLPVGTHAARLTVRYLNP